MSRRSHQTIEVLIRMPLPAGAKPNDGLEFLRFAVQTAAPPPKHKMTGYSFEQSTFKITKRETTYS